MRRPLFPEPDLSTSSTFSTQWRPLVLPGLCALFFCGSPDFAAAGRGTHASSAPTNTDASGPSELSEPLEPLLVISGVVFESLESASPSCSPIERRSFRRSSSTGQAIGRTNHSC